MRILIAYASKSGMTAECAGLLKKQLDGSDVTLANVSEGLPEPSVYDAVIVGSYIRVGKMDRRIAEYLSKYRDSFFDRPLGFFFCCGDISNFEEYVVRCLPSDLSRHAFLTECFGGSLDLCRFHGFEKPVVRLMRSAIRNSTEHDEGQYEKTLPAILPENIGRMATHLRAELLRVRNRDGER